MTPKSNAGAPTTDRMLRHAGRVIQVLRAMRDDRTIPEDVATGVIEEIDALMGALADAQAWASTRKTNPPANVGA